MKQILDLSVAQRLAIGFGLFIVIVAALLVTVLQWHAEGSRAQADYAERIEPLRERSRLVERAILRVAIELRSVLLEPTDERLLAYRLAIGEVRAAVQRMRQGDIETDSGRVLARIEAATPEFLRALDGAVNDRVSAPLDGAAEIHLVSLRDALLADIARFAQLQETKAAAALAQISEIRERTSRGLTLASLLAAVVLSVLAWLTARSISRPTQALLRVAVALEAGDWRPALRLPAVAGPRGAATRDEMKQLARAFGSAAVALEHREERLRADGEVARAIAATLDRDALCNTVLRHVATHLQAEVGVIYWVDSTGVMLQPVASCALDAPPHPLRIGEGVPGQAASERRMVVVRDIPADSGFDVRLGYDRAAPKTVVAAPLLFRGALQGVIVLATLREFTAGALDFLQAATSQLGVGLHNAAAYEQIQLLLGDLRARHEEIQTQNEELQAQNEEIQAQNEEIQAQSQQLQVQHEELQAQNEELIQHSEELRTQAALLADADERKNRFLGVLAHELRNPMAPISNSIFILKRVRPDSDDARRAQEIIERQTQHLVRIIDDLLDVTRISAGKMRIEREIVDLVEVVRMSVEDHAAMYEQGGIALEMDVPERVVAVAGDRTRLAQVLGNLLHNALKFSHPEGKALVSLRIDHAQAQAVLRVSDAGVGLEASLTERLFQPFSQGESGLARTNGGLGLGLALVKALVVLHDGGVEAQSAGPGKGAEFTIRLPLSNPEDFKRTPAPEGAATPVAGAEPADRILIIEDSNDAAHSLKAALELEGYEVAVAYSGPEGVQAAREFMPHLVLCDIGLPEVDGYEVARRLRSDPLFKTVVLIALSGYAARQDREKAEAAGFDLHLAKPLRLHELGRVLVSARDALSSGARASDATDSQA